MFAFCHAITITPTPPAILAFTGLALTEAAGSKGPSQRRLRSRSLTNCVQLQVDERFRQTSSRS